MPCPVGIGMTGAALHLQSTGQGPDLVLLHGWAMHSGYFEPIIEGLASHFRVHRLDLPGHGQSRDYPDPYSIENLAHEILAALTPLLSGKAIWLGWSLGGSVATWIAAHVSSKVAALILVASNPRFVQQPDWPHGVADAVLQEFADGLVNDYKKTLLRFLSLQIRGAEHERERLRQLRNQMHNAAAPETRVLNAGLEILRQFDGRAWLRQLAPPMLIIAGRKDTLVPVMALESIATAPGKARLSIWETAGHAPFLSNPERFINEVKAFADDVIA